MEQSGRDLHEPPQLSSECTGPIKSAIKRSKSISSVNRTLTAGNEHVTTSRSCGTHSSVAAQMQGFGKSTPALGGTVSPQWGWYTTGSTTPPSPELFAHPGQMCSAPSTHDASSCHVRSSNLSQPVGLSSAAFVNMDRRKAAHSHQHPSAQPRPTFTKNTMGISNNRGWPSVPI
jgi:hypothetical protein